MKKKYQVFLSSTYTDLMEARSAIMQALLELDCIPAGMELFPAASESQWKLIQKVIESSDYYIVIVGGRYGSLHKSGLSYTHMEYRYAKRNKIPSIAFLHDDPNQLPLKNCEKDPIIINKFDDFLKELKNDHCKFWGEINQLDGLVSRSLYHLIHNNERPGWIRPSDLVTPNDAGYVTLIESIEKNLDALIYSLNITRPNIYYRALISLADFDKNIRRTLCGINIRNDPEAHVGVPLDYGVSGRAFTSGYIAYDNVNDNDNKNEAPVWSEVRSIAAVPLRDFKKTVIATLNIDSTSLLCDSGLSNRTIQDLIGKISLIIEPLVSQIVGAKQWT